MIGVTLAEAQWFKDNFTYNAVGHTSDEDNPILHNHDAIAMLGLSLTPVDTE